MLCGVAQPHTPYCIGVRYYIWRSIDSRTTQYTVVQHMPTNDMELSSSRRAWCGVTTYYSAHDIRCVCVVYMQYVMIRLLTVVDHNMYVHECHHLTLALRFIEHLYSTKHIPALYV